MGCFWVKPQAEKRRKRRIAESNGSIKHACLGGSLPASETGRAADRPTFPLEHAHTTMLRFYKSSKSFSFSAYKACNEKNTGAWR